jgi:hypothetical protein
MALTGKSDKNQANGAITFEKESTSHSNAYKIFSYANLRGHDSAMSIKAKGVCQLRAS